MTPLMYGIILALGVAVSQDAVMSILWYISHSEEKWSYHHAARLGRLAIGIALCVISIVELVKL